MLAMLRAFLNRIVQVGALDVETATGQRLDRNGDRIGIRNLEP